MTYVQNTWVDQNVERPRTYEVNTNQDGSITLIDSFGDVTELGTPVNATNMNHIEGGIGKLYEGVVLYDAAQTYTNKSIVFFIDENNNVKVYRSLVNNNTGNPLTSAEYWEEIKLGGGGAGGVGSVQWSLLPQSDAGLHLMDGALIQGNGVYREFVQYIANLYDDDPTANYFETEANWQASVTTYGVCGKFVYDSVNNTVRLPKVTGFVEGTIDANALGDLVQAGLPNIQGSLGSSHSTDAGTGTGAGALIGGTWIGTHVQGTTSGTGLVHANIDFDASRSNSIYGNSNTVQPQAIKGFLYIVIANTTKTDIEVDIDEIATDLNGKADVDLTNCTKPHITETYVNGSSWYRIYSDGWCEQGGKITTSQTVSYLKPFLNNNYTLIFGNGTPTIYTGTIPLSELGWYGTSGKTQNGFTATADANHIKDWVACGYIS